ncbi:MAG: response regulator [Myxococcales bacterium]|nr:response regulator [Myxococcales bacterium]MDD9966041.1 response regulator [Myxococcales bacterium]
MARILIIDDSAFTRRQLKKVLASLEHEVVEADSGKDGLEKLVAHKPDFVISDLLMPEMDGFQFIDAVRKGDPELARTPILVLSADVQEASRNRTLDLGAERFLNKPVRPDMVKQALEELAALRKEAS